MRARNRRTTTKIELRSRGTRYRRSLYLPCLNFTSLLRFTEFVLDNLETCNNIARRSTNADKRDRSSIRFDPWWQRSTNNKWARFSWLWNRGINEKGDHFDLVLFSSISRGKVIKLNSTYSIRISKFNFRRKKEGQLLFFYSY